MIWDSERRSKHQRMADAAELVNGKEIPTESIVPFLERVIHCGDKVALEGCNQKQAGFPGPGNDPAGSGKDQRAEHDHSLRIPRRIIWTCFPRASLKS